jgi:hypothetical protein
MNLTKLPRVFSWVDYFYGALAYKYSEPVVLCNSISNVVDKLTDLMHETD